MSQDKYNIFLRIRPIDFQQNMVQSIGDNQLSIKDPAQKNADKMYFKFNQIFTPEMPQDKVFESTCKPIIKNFMKGINSAFLVYGQSRSGKSFTLLGEDLESDQLKGCLPRSIEFLLSQQKPMILKFSILEIYLDQMTDKIKPDSALQIDDNFQGEVYVENLTQAEINSIEDFNEIMAIVQLHFIYTFQPQYTQVDQEELRKRSRSHTVFTITMIYSDPEDPDDQKHAHLQFIDLAGSERIAKTLNEGQKYQEAILINSTLTTIGRCLSMLQQKNFKQSVFKESILTRIVQNCLKPACYVTLIASINPSESNYEECLSTLQYLDRTKNIQIKASQITQQMKDSDKTPLAMQLEKQVRRLTDDNEELRLKIENMEKDFKLKLKDIQKVLSIDVDLEKVSSKAHNKEVQYFKNQKEALVKLENLQRRLAEQELEIEKYKDEIKLLHKQDAQKQEKYSAQILELKEQMRRIKEQLQIEKMNSEDNVRQLNNEKEQVIKRMIEQSNAMLEEKVNAILNLPQNIQTKTADNQKMQEIKKATKLEAEKEFKGLLDKIKQEQTKLLNACKEQYEFFLKEKNQEIDNFINQFKQYRDKKKYEIY